MKNKCSLAMLFAIFMISQTSSFCVADWSPCNVLQHLRTKRDLIIFFPKVSVSALIKGHSSPHLADCSLDLLSHIFRYHLLTSDWPEVHIFCWPFLLSPWLKTQGIVNFVLPAVTLRNRTCLSAFLWFFLILFKTGPCSGPLQLLLCEMN